MLFTSPSPKSVVHPPSVPGASWLRTRMLANVPRVMTRSLPRREPYELNIGGWTPFEIRYWPAGLETAIEPAGLMWSVVTESPRSARTRAPVTGVIGLTSGVRSVKNGGNWM